MNDYMEFEIDLVKKLTPDRPVTTNFMQFYDGLDYRKMTDKLDVISWDSYPRFHNDYESLTDTFARSAFDHAVMRSMKKDRPFMLMESVPGLVNWHDYNTLCYLSGFPGSGLNELFGVTIEELDTYYPNDKNYVTFSNEKQGIVKDYAERIRVQDAEILGTYVEDFYARLVVGTLPAVVLGLAFNDFIESNLGNVQLVGWMLVIGGVFMLFCDKIFNKGSEQTKLTYKRALTIGFIQCIAMIPGVSRSMSTIVGGMSQRLTRKAAAEFSFFLAVPTMFGATCLEVYKLISHGGGSLLTQGNNLVTLLLGSVVAFIVAILAIKFFINYVTKYGFAAFGWYRIVVGLIIIICGLCGVDMQMVD